jgi:predicted GH43/DUF377 family glycosyl hydrolase
MSGSFPKEAVVTASKAMQSSNFKGFGMEWLLKPSKLPDWAIGPFAKYDRNPLLSPPQSGWGSRNVFNPTVVVKDGKFYMLYRAENKDTPRVKGLFYSVLGLAVSDDGLNWKQYQSEPVLSATEAYEWPGGCEDPRMFKYRDTYYVYYSGVHVDAAGDIMVADQCWATSKDLIHWKKHGPRGVKNDSVVTSPQLEAVKINGKFMLYNEQHIGYSDDLVNWRIKPSTISQQIPNFRELCQVMTDIPGREDDIIMLVAAYPDASLHELINKNGVQKGNYPQSSLSFKDANHAVIVEVLLSKKNPEKVLDVSPPVLYPTEFFELEGTNGRGVPFFVVFANQGLFLHEDQWWFYYGGADHVICMAKAPLRRK